jgi:Transcription factor zinc-finger
MTAAGVERLAGLLNQLAEEYPTDPDGTSPVTVALQPPHDPAAGAQLTPGHLDWLADMVERELASSRAAHIDGTGRCGHCRGTGRVGSPRCPSCRASTERIEVEGEEVWRCPACGRRTYGTTDPDADDDLPAFEEDGIVYHGTGEADEEATAELASQQSALDDWDEDDDGDGEPGGDVPAVGSR